MRKLGTLVLIIATAAAQAIGVSPASAATIPVGSVEVATATATGPGLSKTLSATCPAARPRVLGGGFTTTGTHIVATELQPVAGGTVDSYRVTARQDEVGTSASWNLLVYAYCSSAAPGWQLVTTNSSATSDPFNSVPATCPTGKTVVGTGGRINGGGGQVQLVTQTIGSVAPNRMIAGGLEDLTGFGGSWSVTAFAVCVAFNNPLDVRVVSDQLSGTQITKSVPVACPSGMRLTGSSIWADIPGNAINLRPNNNTPFSVTGTARNDTGNTTAGWTLIVYANCAV